ncbi:putative ATPase [Starmerella bacillaris]|uniref:ATPase n=1 Tax=Starmerella bacillaris TaxID=1247836 RepID=A0AAV5RMR4_STABA|nr:putative ATPase [Starmerella bacillaris]
MDLIKHADKKYDVPLNVAIWMAFKPIIKVYLSIGVGFVLSKRKVLTPELQKGISRIVLLVLMPCLIFNNIVSEIKDTDIKLLAVVMFSGFMFYTIGLLWGFVIYAIAPIPRAWFGGLLLCCMINNSSDLPLAYVQAVGGSPLFPSGMAELGQSYCVLFLIIFILFTFNLGGTRLIAWDAHRNEGDPRKNEPTVPAVSWTSIKLAWAHLKEHSHEMLHGDFSSLKKKDHKNTHSENSIAENASNTSGGHEDSEEFTQKYVVDEETSQGTAADPKPDPENGTYPLGRFLTDNSEIRFPPRQGPPRRSIVSSLRSRRSSSVGQARTSGVAGSSDQNSDNDFEDAKSNISGQSDDAQTQTPEAPANPNWRQRKWGRFKVRWFHFKAKNFFTTYICNAIEDIFLPQMISMIIGLTVAMIPWVRRVFVTGQYIRGFRDAPDGLPPLDFFMEFISFFSVAQVPFGLMLLGATMAQLKLKALIPGFWKTLVLIVVFKLCLLPIIACGWITRMRSIGWLDVDDAMTPIVLAIVSGTPSATIQIYLTIGFMKDPNEESVEMNCLAVALLVQYALLPITLTFVGTFVIMHFV